MANNDKTSQIIELLDETKNIIEKKITQIDKDLALDKLRKAYDSLLKIDIISINTNETISSKKVTNESPILIKNENDVTDLVGDNEILTKNNNKQNIINQKVEKQKELNEINILSDEKENVVKIEPTLFESEIDNNIVTLTEEKTNEDNKTLSDKYRKSNIKTLSDSLQIKENQNSSSKLLKPISNIKTAISLNDRIMFNRNLFDNNNDLYNKTIDSINEMDNFDEAKKLIYNTVKNTDSETFTNFLELISRRFI